MKRTQREFPKHYRRKVRLVVCIRGHEGTAYPVKESRPIPRMKAKKEARKWERYPHFVCFTI